MENKQIHRFLGTGTRTGRLKSSDNGKVPVVVHEAFGRLARAKVELETFCNTNHAVVEQLDKLRDAVASATEEAKALYVQHKDTLGPSYEGFTINKRRCIDVNALLALMPESIKFMKHTLTVADFEALVASGSIDDKVAEQVETFTEHVAAPRK